MPDPPAGGDDGIAARLAAARDRYRPVFLQRLAVVEAAVGRAAAGTLDDAARAEAVRCAHDLAGALGTFGLSGSDAASRLEARLGAPDDASPGGEDDLRIIRLSLGTLGESGDG